MLCEHSIVINCIKKNPAKQDSPPAASRASDILPFRCSAIRAERFYFIGRILGQFTRNYTQTTKRGLLTTNKG